MTDAHKSCNTRLQSSEHQIGRCKGHAYHTINTVSRLTMSPLPSE
uniref:Uncharacterized protein n=1 Tax=Anguilla anguilla TaxID=7936 RepID=A0A0E9QL29_ANGAN